MSAHLALVPAFDVYIERTGIEGPNPAKLPCPGLYNEQWQKTHTRLLDVMERFGAQVVDLGLTDLDLFSHHE